MTDKELVELRAAAARLFYNNNRNSEDFKMLIAFIERIYEKEECEGNGRT